MVISIWFVPRRNVWWLSFPEHEIVLMTLIAWWTSRRGCPRRRPHAASAELSCVNRMNLHAARRWLSVTNYHRFDFVLLFAFPSTVERTSIGFSGNNARSLNIRMVTMYIFFFNEKQAKYESTMVWAKLVKTKLKSKKNV